MVNTKHAFWLALIFTIGLFLAGFFLGVFLEDTKANKIQDVLLNSEINLLDEQLKENVIQEFNISCKEAKESNFRFADRIYEEALKLEQYDSSTKLRGTLTIYHRRYDLLRVLLWTDSIKIKEECKSDFHTIIFMYDYDTTGIKQKAEQIALSNMLLDFKYKYPDKTLLIPIAANLNIESVNLIKKRYNITSSPTIIIDEKIIIDDLIKFDDFEKIVFDSNNK